ncbi:class I SAM-dependent methyltransferase [Bacteroidia bacterium]|nr:class I SAM-dependent methyltransferase [Bacteroidia bacterium]
MNKKNLQNILETNHRQKDFYNSNKKNKKNLPTKIWSGIRNGILSNFRNQFDIKKRVYSQHKIWLGDLTHKKVLDLGCLRGNALSIYIAKNSKEYIGIDLSDVAISDLDKKLKKENCENSKAIAIDFLSPDFKETDFDIIYAYGVLHHFEDFDILINKLKEKLNHKGKIISYDPLQTSRPIKIIRAIYRPFQSDKDWEWPFNKKVLQKIKSNFKILDKKGILGKSKYSILINLIPISKSIKEKIIKNYIEKDWSLKDIEDAYNCMHLTLYLENN